MHEYKDRLLVKIRNGGQVRIQKTFNNRNKQIKVENNSRCFWMYRFERGKNISCKVFTGRYFIGFIALTFCTKETLT